MEYLKNHFRSFNVSLAKIVFTALFNLESSLYTVKYPCFYPIFSFCNTFSGKLYVEY